MELAWTSVTTPVDPLAHNAFRSPSLKLLMEKLEEAHLEILDLGPPVEANIDFFSHVSCRLHIEDLYRHLIAEPIPIGEDEDPVPRLTEAVDSALAHDANAGIDIILGWDLFNYMDPSTIRVLMRRVAQSCRPGTLLFLMISNLDAIPGVPAKITLDLDGTLAYAPASNSLIPNRRYTPLALERMMTRFGLLHSFLLGEGMQDYLFVFR